MPVLTDYPIPPRFFTPTYQVKSGFAWVPQISSGLSYHTTCPQILFARTISLMSCICFVSYISICRSSDTSEPCLGEGRNDCLSTQPILEKGQSTPSHRSNISLPFVLSSKTNRHRICCGRSLHKWWVYTFGSFCISVSGGCILLIPHW